MNLNELFSDVNIGIDIIALNRLIDILNRSGERFTKRVFTPLELEEANAHGNYTATLAGCFAAKGAVIKGLSLSPGEDLALTDIQITHGPGGAPTAVLSGQAAEVARRRGIEKIKVSLSWEEEYAVAVALLLGSGGDK